LRRRDDESRSMKPPRSRLRVLYPLGLLWLRVSAALYIRPAIGTLISAEVLIAVAGSRSFIRRDTWSLADPITTTRLGLIINFCAMTRTAPGFNWPATTVGAVALALDGIDGVAARCVGTTASGAVFDESVDALFILLLGLGLIPLWGVWTILPGAMYYLFHAIAFFRPAWRRRLPSSRLRKVIAAAQGILLLSAGSPVAQDYWWFGIGCVGLALVALLFSFGRDVLWLEHAQRQPAPR